MYDVLYVLYTICEPSVEPCKAASERFRPLWVGRNSLKDTPPSSPLSMERSGSVALRIATYIYCPLYPSFVFFLSTSPLFSDVVLRTQSWPSFLVVQSRLVFESPVGDLAL
jgi:hypothetical protein